MLEMFFDESAFAQALIQNLQAIPAGNDDASRYHHHALAICTVLFHPQLITPVKEFELHQGRKRLDIRFTNAAESGFFQAMMVSPQGRALSIPVECKNYRKEMRNPELDQLSGRFSHHRGFVGLLLCRSMDRTGTRQCRPLSQPLKQLCGARPPRLLRGDDSGLDRRGPGG